MGRFWPEPNWIPWLAGALAVGVLGGVVAEGQAVKRQHPPECPAGQVAMCACEPVPPAPTFVSSK